MSRVADLLRSLALTAGEIAGTSRLPTERVSAIMEGAPADLSELRALSRGLHLPMRAFATGRRAADVGGEVGVRFRGAVRETPPAQRATVDYVAGFVEAALAVLPKRHSTPAWLKEMKPAEQTFLEAHRLAHRFRNLFMDGRENDPALNLPQILSDVTGTIIGGLHLSRYEGASVIAGGYSFVFISPRFLARMLFTLAHELGHIVAHHGREESAVFDRTTQIGAWRHRTLEERFVDAFASILLLPDRGVGLALKTVRQALNVSSGNIGDVEILYLARFFGVSFEVAARRCEQLELLPEGGAISLTELLRKRFGSPERRAEELGLPPRPGILLPKVSDNLLRPLMKSLEAGTVSTGWAAERFGLSIEELFTAHARLVHERDR